MELVAARATRVHRFSELSFYVRFVFELFKLVVARATRVTLPGLIYF